MDIGNKRIFEPSVYTAPTPAKYPKLEESLTTHSHVYQKMNEWLVEPARAEEIIPKHLLEGMELLLENSEVTRKVAETIIGKYAQEYLTVLENLRLSVGLRCMVAEIALDKATTPQQKVRAALFRNLPNPSKFEFPTNLPETRLECIEKLTPLINDHHLAPVVAYFLTKKGNFPKDGTPQILMSMFMLGMAIDAPRNINNWMYNLAVAKTTETHDLVELLKASVPYVDPRKTMQHVRIVLFQGDPKIVKTYLSELKPYVHYARLSELEKKHLYLVTDTPGSTHLLD